MSSFAIVAPSISRTGTLPISNQDPKRRIGRSQTFACFPPATRTGTGLSSGFIKNNNNNIKRAPTFGFGLRKPRRTRTGFIHFEPRKNKKALIISGYTCIGKTTFRRKIVLQKKQHLRIIDLDSSAFSRDPTFPQNYLDAIRQHADERSIILISTHEEVASELTNEGYYVALVYPEGSYETKREWLRRLEEREQGGKESRLYQLVDANWDDWYALMTNREVSKKVTLSQKDYLLSVFGDIYKDFFLNVVIS